MNFKFILFLIGMLLFSCKPNTGLEDQLKSNPDNSPGTDSNVSPKISMLNLKEELLPSQDIYNGSYGGIHIIRDSLGDHAIAGLFKITDVVNGSYRYVLYYWQQINGAWITREMKNSPNMFFTYSYNYGERNFIRIVKTNQNTYFYYLDQYKNLKVIDYNRKTETNLNTSCRVFDAKVNPANDVVTVACLKYDYITTSITLIKNNQTTQNLSVSGSYQWTDSNVELNFIDGKEVVLFKGTEFNYKTNYLVALYDGLTFQIANGVDREGSINSELVSGFLFTCARDFANYRYILSVDFYTNRKTRYDVSTKSLNESPYSCRTHKSGRYHIQFNSSYNYTTNFEITDRSTNRIETSKYFQINEFLSFESIDLKLAIAGLDRVTRRVRLIYEE
ncbi:MAG: hypothetical protein OHK0056_25110 [Bacteriovoracaceae bacterium]